MAENKTPNVYDIEQFGGNFFCSSHKLLNLDSYATFIIFYDTEGDRHINQLGDLYYYLNTAGICVSYNGDGYDNLMISYLIKNKEEFLKLTVRQLITKMQKFSDLLISTSNFSGDFRNDPPEVVELKRVNYIKTYDMMNLSNTIDKTSLKTIAVNMKWPRIQDLPFPPNHVVKYEEITKIIDYNLNDVHILEAYVNLKSDIIKDRIEMSTVFGFNMREDNDTNIAKKLYDKLYREKTGNSIRAFKSKGTFRDRIELKECVVPKVHFITERYNNMLKRIKEKVTNPNESEDGGKKALLEYRNGYFEAVNKEFEFSVGSKYINHTIAKGGIHSENVPEIIEETDEYDLYDVDASSYYPYMMYLYRFYPKHLGPIFIEILKGIIDERIRAKKAKEKKAGVLKISANGTYGLTKLKSSELYDPKVTLSTCINGELFLLMLIERLEILSNCVAVYSNTDGLTIKVPKSETENFKRITKNWESYTGFELEMVRYKKMVIKGVNDYYIQYYGKDDATGEEIIKEKVKGLFVDPFKDDKIDVSLLHKGYDCPIVARALCAYYRDDTPVMETIKSCKDIFMFLRSQKSDINKFDIIALKGKEQIVCQKTNRWAITKGNPDECIIYTKSKETGKKENLQKGYTVTIFNDVDPFIDITTVHLNYEYYEHACLKIINSIKTKNKSSWIKPIVIQQELEL